ncbi:MAG: CBS domain-containing protein [Bacteroidota bacterium]
MIVQRLMAEWPEPLPATLTAGLAIEQFADAAPSVRHLPVVDNQGLLFGMVDLETVMDVPAETEVGQLVMTPSPRVAPDAHPFEAAALVMQHGLSALPVIDEDGEYLGLLTRVRLFERIALLTAAAREGGIVVVEMAAADYTLGQLVYVIEQNGVKILSVTTEFDGLEHGSARVTLKLNTSDTARIRHVLGHYGYRIDEYHDSGSSEDFQLRLQELMRYLEV